MSQIRKVMNLKEGPIEPYDGHVYYCICGPDHEDDACPEHGTDADLGQSDRHGYRPDDWNED